MAQPRPLPAAEPSDLQINPSQGLSSEEAAARISRYGPNLLAPSATGSNWRRLLQAISDPMVLILFAAGILFLGLGQTRDGIIILAAIAPVIVVDVVLELRAERTLERLREMASPRALVRRDGREIQLPAEQLVPGDVLLLQEGDVIPADAVVESQANLQMDEAALTGESLPVAKKGAGWPALGPALEDRGARVFAGTTVVSGRATAIVTVTGARTEYGQIGTMVAQAPSQITPLQRAISNLVKLLGIIAVVASLAVAALELFRGAGWVDAILAGVSLAIAAIPEEFAIVFALYLSLGAWRMARRNALVRNLAGVETLGSTTVICTDKTGTLTKGQLCVGGLYADGQIQWEGYSVASPEVRCLLENALLASEPHPFDPLDLAICALAQEAGMNPEELYGRYTLAQDYPFDPERKYVTHVWRSPEGKLRLTSKGSIEGILEISQPPAGQRDAALKANEEFTSRGMRVIAVAEKQLNGPLGERWANGARMRLVGLIGFADPPREGVREAVGECQTAGVRVIMITGDHPLTAHAVAEEIGLYHDDQQILTGQQMAQMSDDELEQALGSTAIFARMLPAQKLRIVQGLKARRQVVAMTGDGINDAPALRTADIGVAMGRRGTQVAREAATMVLLDDNFGTIVEAIRQGRRIFDNLVRAFFYLLTLDIPIVLAALVIPLVGAPLMLLPIHLVWIELIIHPTSAVVFEADPADPNLMRRPPRNPRQPIFDRRTGILAGVEGFTIFLGVLAVYLGFLAVGTPQDQARTLGVSTLVLALMVLVLQSRAFHRPIWRVSILRNRTVVPMMLLTLVSLALMIYVPGLASAAQFAPPTLGEWAIAAGAALASTLLFEPIKAVW